MKRITTIFLTVIFVMLAGCGRTVTRKYLDEAGQPVTVRTEKSFFASEKRSTACVIISLG